MSDEAEPVTKKQKSTDDWKDHKMNIGGAVMKEDEGKNLNDIKASGIRSIQGIGEKSADEISTALGLETVADMATYKFYVICKGIVTLAATEETRPSGSVMNIDRALDKDSEAKSLKELLDCPLSVLQGLTEKVDGALKVLGIGTIGELGTNKYFQYAEAIAALADYEELQTAEERKAEKLQKQLA